MTAGLRLAAATLDGFAAMLGGVGPSGELEPVEPSWTTPNRIVLELPALRLREFADGPGQPVVIVTPFALHGPVLADLAPHHSLVEHLLDSGIRRLLLVECKSAEAHMTFLGIDDYLAQLAIVHDELGSAAALVGLCQGGWLSLMFATRVPSKVARLVLAGSPIDVDAATSSITEIARGLPSDTFHQLVEDGHGRIIGQRMLGFWNARDLERQAVSDVLQIEEPYPELLDRFRAWHSWTVDLPGAYYLQIVDELFRGNKLARGEFCALGRVLELSRVRMPLYLLASEDDEVTPPGQLMAAARLVGTPKSKIRTTLVGGSHLSLFIGETNIKIAWTDIADWLRREGNGKSTRRAGTPRQSARHTLVPP